MNTNGVASAVVDAPADVPLATGLDPRRPAETQLEHDGSMPNGSTWRSLGPGAKTFRIAHTAWAVVGMASLGYIWLSALTGRRDRVLAASTAFLSIEGVALVAGRGDCPFGPLQTRLGDPIPLFELVLPPPAARAAVPVLCLATLSGLATLAVRPRGAHDDPPAHAGRDQRGGDTCARS